MGDEDFLDSLADDLGEGDAEGSQAIGIGGDAARSAIYDVSIDIVAVLGTAELKVSQILQLGRGAVVELERLIGEPVELHAARQLVAKGEVVVIEDRLAVQLTEVIRDKLPS